MTLEEAQFVAVIACTTDGGCNVCASKLIKQFITEFPEHKQVFLTVFNEAFDEEAVDIPDYC